MLDLLKYGYPRDLYRLEAGMPVASAGDADFPMVQRMGLLADLLEKQYKMAEAKEVRHVHLLLSMPDQPTDQ